MDLAERIVDVALDRTVVPGYTRIGYAVRRRFWPDDPAEDALDGATAVVTGANSGLGKAAATGLARLGATTHLVVRDKDKGDAARDEILAEVPSAHVEVHVCDVSLLRSVREFAAGFLDGHGSVDVLVHNAGVLPPERTETAEGNESVLATHVLGPHLLTALLSPALSAARGRVVFVSSGGMYTAPLKVDDPQFTRSSYTGAKAYARTKRMQVALARLWDDALPDVAVHSMHPGWADTPGVSTSLPTFDRIMGPLLRTPQQGADTIVWLGATSQEGGRFWHDRRPRPTHVLPWAGDDPAQARRLWTYCEQRTVTG